MIRLYAATIDADCFAARLLLAILGVEYETVAVDAYLGVDAGSREILAAGPLPVLQDLPTRVAGLWPTLEHLAAAYRTALLAPPHPESLALVKRLRADTLAGELPTDDDLAQARRALLALEDDVTLRRLTGWRFLAGPDPTIADLALYPAVALSRDLGLEHDEFPALRHWLRDVRALAPGVHMPGVLDPV